LKAKQEKQKAVKLILHLLGKDAVQSLLSPSNSNPNGSSSSPKPMTSPQHITATSPTAAVRSNSLKRASTMTPTNVSSSTTARSPSLKVGTITPSTSRSMSKLFNDEFDNALNTVSNPGNSGTSGNSDLLERLITALELKPISPKPRKSVK
jgi:hypothetical protein